jgi:hypothetical protein
MTKAVLFAVALGGAVSASCATSPPEAPAIEVVYNYDEMDRFAAAIAAIDAGADPAEQMHQYVSDASPEFQFFAGRFDVTPESMLRRLQQFPRYYRYLTTVKSEIQGREAEFTAALARLTAMAPAGSRPVPFHFLIANQTAGGQPGFVPTPQGDRYFITVGVDVVAMSPRVDMSEFPNGAGGRQRLADLGQVLVHEMAHVYQRQLQGLDNYRSIYTDASRSTNLAFALREGCADYITWLASGWRLGDRYAYAAAHEEELWAAFEPIMRDRQDGASGWFGSASDAHPDWPSQIGYSLGEIICRAYYEEAGDKRAALTTIYGAYLPEHFETIAAPYVTQQRR